MGPFVWGFVRSNVLEEEEREKQFDYDIIKVLMKNKKFNFIY